MSLTSKQLQIYVIAGVIVIAALWLFLKKSGSIGFAVGQGAANLVTGTATGVVVGAGQGVGIPQTNASQCALCKKLGDIWGASKYCTATEFTAWLLAGMPKQ